MKRVCRYLILTVAGLLASTLGSCERTLATDVPEGVLQEGLIIPLELQLANLEEFLSENGFLTKGTSTEVASFFMVTADGASSTKSALEAPVFYAVNLEPSGFALLAADYRLRDDVVLYSPVGELTEDMFSSSYEDGVPSEDDDVTEEEYRAMLDNGSVAECRKETSMMMRSCLGYARDCIDSYADESPAAGARKSGGEKSESHWMTVESTPRLIHWRWHQGSPFNQYYGYVGRRHKTQAPVGCGPLAIGTIAAYLEYPKSIDGVPLALDYSAMKTICPDERVYDYGAEEAQRCVASFLHSISKLADAKSFKFAGTAYTFTWPGDCAEAFRKLGYKDVELTRRFDEDKILKALRNGLPVWMAGVAGLVNAHCWVADSYIIREYVNSKGKVTKSQTLLHVLWGEGSFGDGFYVTSRAFRTNHPEIPDGIRDSGYGKEYIYWHNFFTITYADPRKNQ